jgi:hypothetical protein
MWLPAGCLLFTRLGILSTTVTTVRFVGEFTVVPRQLVALVELYKVITEFLTIDFAVVVGFGRAGWPGQHILVARDRCLQFQVFCPGLA